MNGVLLSHSNFGNIIYLVENRRKQEWFDVLEHTLKKLRLNQIFPVFFNHLILAQQFKIYEPQYHTIKNVRQEVRNN